MPLYEYTCHGCKRQVELLIRGQEQPICPECGSQRLEKELSVVAAHVGGHASELPICDTPRSGGGCGLPQCGSGMCQFD
jgi:putative FmdB family regulatory protein